MPTEFYDRRALRSACKYLLTCAVLLALAHPVSAQHVNFDFSDADLRTVIQAVAEFTGKNFLVDPRVKGKVTVVAPDPLTEDEAYQAFLSVLEVNGFVTVEADGVTKIVPQEEGRTRDTSRPGKGIQANGDGMVTRVIRLSHARADKLLPLLRPLVPAYGHLAADADTASLVITDRSSNVKRLIGIIQRLDRPSETGEIELIQLNHASAEHLARLMGELHRSHGEGAAPGPVITADPRTNTLIVRADEASRRDIRSLVQELDSPSSVSGDTHVIYLKNADAEQMVEVLEESIKGNNGEDAGRVNSKVTITADPATNSLIIGASKSDFLALERVVRKLDIRRLQVYVEALIADVSTDNLQELGVQWQAGEGLKDDTRGVIGGTSFSVSDSIQSVALNPLTAGPGLALGYIDGTITLPDGTEIANLSVLAQALEAQNDANVLSTPNILTMDNQEAEIVIGQNVPFVTGSFAAVANGTAVDNPFQTIERHDVGLTLRIRPQITEGSAIKMDIYQEVSSVAQRGEATDLVTNTRSIQTTVVAEDNRMLVLGGLIQDDIARNEQKIPLLGDIPLLGRLFKFQGESRVKTNLLVFLRPRIIRSNEDLDQPTQKKYDYIKGLSESQQLVPDTSRRPPIDSWEMIRPPIAAENATN